MRRVEVNRQMHEHSCFDTKKRLLKNNSKENGELLERIRRNAFETTTEATRRRRRFFADAFFEVSSEKSRLGRGSGKSGERLVPSTGDKSPVLGADSWTSEKEVGVAVRAGEWRECGSGKRRS